MKKNNFKLLMLAFLICISFTSWAQTIQVSGVVLDELKVPLPGANVSIKGTTKGTTTDIEGNFTIAVSGVNQKLVFGYIGYLSKEVVVDGTSNKIIIQLVSGSTSLEQVVVIGYGSVKKKDLTGSVVSMDAKKLTEMKKIGVAEAMQGRLSGVDISRVSSKPGGGLSIKIRGNTVIKNTNVLADGNGNSNDLASDLSKPLYVVDGVFIDDISIINPSDIEQLDVLKDASATAIYGSRGANGVVIITTKSGVVGKTQITYDSTFGFNNKAYDVPMMNGNQYVAYASDFLKAKQWIAQNNAGTASVDSFNNTPINLNTVFFNANEQNNVANKNYTYWPELLNKKNQIQTSHNFGMSGGKDGLTYNASIGMTKNDGISGIEGYDRYTISASVANKFNDKVSMGAKMYYTFSERETGSPEMFRTSYRLAPTVDPYNDDGSLTLFPDAQDLRFVNPIYEANGSWISNTRTTDLIANIFLNYKPAKWVELKTNFAPQIVNSRYGEYSGLLTRDARNDITRTLATFNTNMNTGFNWDNSAAFNFNITEGHKLKALLISSLYRQQDEGSMTKTRNVNSDNYSFYNTQGGLTPLIYDSYYSKETLASFTARVNYDINDKYLFTFTGRYDGSSKLASGHQWAFFPSAAFAWKVSNEKFMQDVNWISDLKLRLSYGQSGNNAPVSRYASQGFLTNADYTFGGTAVIGNTIGSLINPELGWEVSSEYNLGLNFNVLKGRLAVDVEVYNKTTEDAILNRSLMLLTGYAASTGNYGSVRNKGIELALNSVNVKTKDFKWETNINFSKNVNEIIKLAGGLNKEVYGAHGVLQVGKPVDAAYSYEKVGIWQMDEAAAAKVYGQYPGMYKFVDQNNDGKINQLDKVVLGSNSPKWIGGMTNSFSYQGFDFSVLAYTRQGAYGHSEFYNAFAPHNPDGGAFNVLKLNYWTPNNQGGTYPMPTVAALPSGVDEWYYEDMSFVKIGNIGLGYNLPERTLEKLKISSLRLSLDFQNPYIFTKHKGPDPETALQGTFAMANPITSTVFGLKIKI
jgi:TonB-linked SusC/RagA family outer membrane protein